MAYSFLTFTRSFTAFSAHYTVTPSPPAGISPTGFGVSNTFSRSRNIYTGVTHCAALYHPFRVQCSEQTESSLPCLHTHLSAKGC